MKSDILAIMRQIIDLELNAEKRQNAKDVTYMDQRTIINNIFSSTEEFSKSQIILRLVIIDSLYSTNASYNYFSFDQMADAIWDIGINCISPFEKQTAIRDYFYDISTRKSTDYANIFSKTYGIKKNLDAGSMQMSLMSKYAYYELLQNKEKYPLGFPIYDRLVKGTYPTVRRILGEDFFYSLPQIETPKIEQYVFCIDQLRLALFSEGDGIDSNNLFYGYQQFDILDAYLWRMGKFNDGNLSLLLGESDYRLFIKNIGLEAPKEEQKRLCYEQSLSKLYNEKIASSYQKKALAIAEENKAEIKKYNFNDIVRYLLENNNAIYQGLILEHYMNSLWNHWKNVFIQNDNIFPRRGKKLPEIKECLVNTAHSIDKHNYGEVVTIN